MAPCDAQAEIYRLRQQCELLQEAVNWCLASGAGADGESVFCVSTAVIGIGNPRLNVPAKFSEIIKPMEMQR